MSLKIEALGQLPAKGLNTGSFGRFMPGGNCDDAELASFRHRRLAQVAGDERLATQASGFGERPVSRTGEDPNSLNTIVGQLGPDGDRFALECRFNSAHQPG